jgi:cell division septal protein FtsQ
MVEISNKKYIKNCTGDHCKFNPSAKTSAASRTVSRIAFYFLCVAFVAVSFYVLFFSSYLQIVNISVSGNNELSSQDIRKTFEASLGGNFFKLIPKNNFLLVSQEKVTQLLENDFKKIRTVSVTKKFPDAVSITVSERKALLVWCAGENCYLIDENGAAYNSADFNSPEMMQNHLIKITDLSAREVAIGEKVLDVSYEQYVLGLKDVLGSVGQAVDDETYSTPSNMADEIDVKTTGGMQLYFSTQFPLEAAVRTLDIVLKKEIPQNKQSDIDYIDLRSEGRVFYKFKN